MPAPADLVHQQSTSSGTGSLSLSAVTGKRTFATAFGTGTTTNVFTYFIIGQANDEWEIGTGHMSNSTTLVRDTVIASSNSNAAVNFSGGLLDVMNDIQAANQVRNESGTNADGEIVVMDGPTGRKIKSAGVLATALIPPPQGRLTLSTGVPVMNSTVSAATTIYYTPYVGQIVPIYDGTKLVPTDTGGELSQALTDTTKSPAAATTNSNYDLFVWNDSGTIRCTRGPAWSSDTSRGTGAGTTELQRVNGILTNKQVITNGPAANRGTYVGTIRTNGSSQVDFSVGGAGSGGVAAFLGVWNYYNRSSVAVSVNDTSSYTYSSNTIRPANNSTANRISLVQSLAEDGLIAAYTQRVNSTANAGAFSQWGIALDNTTSFSSPICLVNPASNVITTQIQGCIFITNPGIGFHYLQAVEQSDGTHANTFNSTSGGTNPAILSAIVKM